MPSQSDGYIVSCFGAPRSGKTTFAARVAIREVQRGRTCLVFDPTGDVRKRLSGDSAHGERVEPHLFASAKTGSEVEAATRESWFLKKERPRVIMLNSYDVAFAAETLHWVAGRAWARNWVLLIDEVEEVWDTRLPRDDSRRTIKFVGNRGQVLIAAGQRPQATTTLLRSNTTHACIFKSDSRQFVEGGTREFGDPELFDRTYTLPQFHFLYRAPWRDDPRTPLPEIDGLKDPIPW